MEAVKAGGDRQDLHERIRVHAQEAGHRVKHLGLDNDLIDLLKADPAFAAVHDRLTEGRPARPDEVRRAIGRADRAVHRRGGRAAARERYGTEPLDSDAGLGSDTEPRVSPVSASRNVRLVRFTPAILSQRSSLNSWMPRSEASRMMADLDEVPSFSWIARTWHSIVRTLRSCRSAISLFDRPIARSNIVRFSAGVSASRAPKSAVLENVDRPRVGEPRADRGLHDHAECAPRAVGLGVERDDAAEPRPPVPELEEVAGLVLVDHAAHELDTLIGGVARAEIAVRRADEFLGAQPGVRGVERVAPDRPVPVVAHDGRDPRNR
jgi:hypothetical protein